VLNFSPKKAGEEQKHTTPDEDEDDANKISKIIKLKHNRLKDDLLAYIRMSLI